MTLRRLAVALSMTLAAGALAATVVPGAAFAAAPTGAAAVRSPSDARQVKVSWKPVKGADHYTVELFDGITDTVAHVPPQAAALTLDASEPCAKYMIRVGSVDAKGAGYVTGWMTVKPLAPGAPGGLTAARTGDRTSVAARWNAPSWSGYGPLSGYRAQLIRLPDNRVVADRTVQDRSILLTDVERTAKYSLVVSAYNQFGTCASAKTAIATDQPDKPTDLTAVRTVGAPGVVTASWKPPAGTVPVTYYNIGYWAPGKATKWQRVDGPATSVTLTLDSTKSWSLRAQSFNEVGGSPTLSNTVSLAPAASSPPPASSTPTAPPRITAAVSPKPSAGTWYNARVTVTFTCTDGQPGVQCPAPVTLADDGVNQQVTGTATNKAGRTATSTVTVNIDKTAPVITAAVSPEPNASGWRNGPATVTFTCSDDLSGIDVCPKPVTVPDDLVQRVVVTGTARDKAGNVANASVTVNSDRTPPTITGTTSPTPNQDGWSNKDVTVAFDCSDAQSGIDSCPAPTTVATEGTNQTVSGTATDYAGNTATARVNVNLDKTLPTVTARLNPQLNANGWTNGDVEVVFACTDTLSGIKTCTPPVSLTEEGAGQTVTGTATDRAGNTAGTSATVNIDKTPPVIEATVSGVNGTEGWSNGPVRIHYTCSDALSGIADCPDDAVVDTDGAGQTVTRTAVDRAGNTATATTVINIDRSHPVITAMRTAPNGYGWNNGPVTITYACAAPVSGVASCSEPVTVTDEGVGRLAHGTVTNKAGTAAMVDTTINIDSTPPTITATLSGTRAGAGWYRGPVTIHYTCTDGLSAVAACPADVTLSDNGANQTVTRTAVDKAGNTAVAVTTVNIDGSSPVVSATVDGTKNAAGWYRGPVTIHYTCTDSISGIAACPADVSVPEGNNQSVTRSATDKAGNTASSVVSGIRTDRTAPGVGVTGASKGGSYPLDQMPTLSCTATDTLSGVANQTHVTITRDAIGNYTAACSEASDVAGNTSAQVSIGYKVVPTVAGLVQLTDVYAQTSGAANANGQASKLDAMLLKGDYCKYVKEVNDQIAAKSPVLTAAQGAELIYWARILKPTC